MGAMVRRQLAAFLVLGGVLVSACAVELQSLAGDNAYLPKSPSPARHILAIPVEALGADERIALTCLQGLLARQQPRLWLIRTEADRFWLERHRLKGYIKSYEVETNWTGLFRRFGPICTGAIIPDQNLYRGDLIAATVAACEDAIVTPRELATRLDLMVKVDLRGQFTNYADALTWVWRRYRSRLSPQFCDFRQPELLSYCTFDYSYEFCAPMFWIAGPKEAQRRGTEPDREKRIVEEILAEMKPNGVCVGFPAGTQGDGYGIGETKGVELLSRRGYALVCNNWEANCSILSGVRIRRLKQPKQPPPPALDRRKIYIALVLSDGDNEILWPEFFKGYFNHPAFGRFPLAFGMGPAARELQPGIIGWYFEQAKPTTEFIADVSGAGYIQPDYFALERLAPEQVWADFLGWTSRLMRACGMNSVRTVNGNDRTLARYSASLPFCHSLFADMGRYSGISGITNLTYSLPGGMPVFRAVTTWTKGKEGFLEEIRDQVGGHRPAFVNGFVHCWTFNMDDLVKVYDKRDSDMVFVTPAQLAKLYRQCFAVGRSQGQ